MVLCSGLSTRDFLNIQKAATTHKYHPELPCPARTRSNSTMPLPIILVSEPQFHSGTVPGHSGDFQPESRLARTSALIRHTKAVLGPCERLCMKLLRSYSPDDGCSAGSTFSQCSPQPTVTHPPPLPYTIPAALRFWKAHLCLGARLARCVAYKARLEAKPTSFVEPRTSKVPKIMVLILQYRV